MDVRHREGVAVTQGNWEAAIVSGPDGKDWIGVGEAHHEYPRMGKVVALCGTVHGKYEQDSIDDARLIAEAPALLKTLRETVCRVCGDFFFAPPKCGLSDHEDAHAVIIRAEGGK